MESCEYFKKFKMQKLEQVLRHEKFSALIVFVLFFVVAVLSVGRVFAANRLVETSDNLRRMDLEVSKLEQQNQALAEEVRSQESMVYVENKIAQLGFGESSRYAYLTPSTEVALLP